MQELKAGVHRYLTDVHPDKQPLFDSLATGQSPSVMFITCADSRIDPSLITQTEPGDLFVARNAGNIIPASDADLSAEGTVASVEYAVSALQVSHIVVCGHADCGAVKAAMNPVSASEMAQVSAWIDHADTGGHSDLSAAIEANVMAQLRNLMSYDFVSDAVETGTLTLAGWVYDIATGMVRVRAAETGGANGSGTFTPITATAGSSQ